MALTSAVAVAEHRSLPMRSRQASASVIVRAVANASEKRTASSSPRTPTVSGRQTRCTTVGTRSASTLKTRSGMWRSASSTPRPANGGGLPIGTVSTRLDALIRSSTHGNPGSRASSGTDSPLTTTTVCTSSRTAAARSATQRNLERLAAQPAQGECSRSITVTRRQESEGFSVTAATSRSEPCVTTPLYSGRQPTTLSVTAPDILHVVINGLALRYL